jgi:hypothetical protein
MHNLINNSARVNNKKIQETFRTKGGLECPGNLVWKIQETLE